MLVLNASEIEESINHNQLIAAIKLAYLHQSKTTNIIPQRQHLKLNHGELLVMPGAVEDILGAKLVTVFENNKVASKAAINGAMLLFDSANGALDCLLDGSKITSLRTAGLGALAARQLSKPETKTCGLFGAGTQALAQTLKIHEELKFRNLLIHNRSIDNAELLVKVLSSKLPTLNCQIVYSPEILVERSELIICATASKTSLFDPEGLDLKGKTIIAIGSYRRDMSELAPQVFKQVQNVYVDSLEAIHSAGDLVIPLNLNILSPDQIVPFHKIAHDRSHYDENRLNVFKSVGNAIFDLTLAKQVYLNAIENNLGTKIDLN